MIVQLIGAFLAIAAFAVMLETPKRYLWCAGAVGAAGWLVYMVSMQFGADEILATFFSTMIISVVSHIFARLFRAPVTVFLIAGILPTVPGAGMYRIVYYLLEGNKELALHYLILTLELAGVIALGVFVVDAFFRLFSKSWKQNSMRYRLPKS
ncbi:MAG: threonine/serine exporter family protein [Faecalimonas sp.]|nr:threonine/serine exporter family protein [Faecalimonas sp.]